jgi:tungstate transport system ATP-binding protein
MATPDALYRLDAIQHRYGDRLVLEIPRLEIFRGETLAIIGPSGAGKSTLLRLLQFLESPTSGRIAFAGRLVDGELPLDERRRITTVFQRPVVLNRSVRDNLTYGLRIRGIKETPNRVEERLNAVGLAALACQPAQKLSGGEMQRLAVARALAFDPEVLLLDEPTAHLDPQNARMVEALLSERHQRGVTIVLAAHQMFQARRLADRTALLLDGRLVEIANTTRFFGAPEDTRTRAFLTGAMIY